VEKAKMKPLEQIKREAREAYQSFDTEDRRVDDYEAAEKKIEQ
jgi:hypothetical protein